MKSSLFVVIAVAMALGFNANFSQELQTVGKLEPNHALANSKRVVNSAFRIFLGEQSGTAFVVESAEKDLYLVTAGHTFKKSDRREAKIVTRDSEGQRKELKIIVRNSDGVPLWKSHSKHDIAAIKIELDHPLSQFRYTEKQVLTEEYFELGLVSVGTDCMIPCFPAKLESTSGGYPVLRKGSIASHPIDPATNATFLVDYHAFGGDSGAPVVASIKPTPDSNAELAIIGLVFAQTRQTDKSVTPFEERVVHTPIGLGIAVNSKFILETIRKR